MEAIKLYNKNPVQKGISSVRDDISEVEIIMGAVDYLLLIEDMENIAGEHETQAILDALERKGITLRSTTFQG